MSNHANNKVIGDKVINKPKKLPLHLKLVVGALAGAFGTTCIFPIDMIKTRLQSRGLYTGPLDCFKKIFSNEGGIRAFYKGLGPNLIGVIPEKAIKLVNKKY
jgi:solute carrier family 25 aspartate/glutamate transporter 12/13